MEDDNSKEDNQPSTSKKESQRENSVHDLYDERRGQDGQMTNSDSSVSAAYSLRSRLDINNARQDVPKPPTGKLRDQKLPERKKRGRRVTGRVDKRKRSSRRVMRRAIKRRPRIKDDRKKREPSISSVFTRLSSVGSRSRGCVHCGHRCCRRRFEEEKIKAKRKRMPKNIRQKHYTTRMSGLESIQVGSASKMLSPLFVNNSSLPKPDETSEDETGYCEITPIMIHKTLQRLSRWRQYVMTQSIMEDMKSHYPVNPDQESLLTELREKLRVATIIGMVASFPNEYWCLNCTLQNRQLSHSHVTRFWQAYGDTMKPVTKKALDEEQKKELEERQTNTNTRKKNMNITYTYTYT